MSEPLVSVICLCHNQAAFVQEALDSVWAQTYPRVELIIVDDGSTDNSVPVIRSVLMDKPEVQFLEIPQSVGNCRAFNQGLTLSKGEFIIDLAADDVLMAERISEGVKTFRLGGEEFGVHFSDAVYIDEGGRVLRQHYKRNKNGALAEKVPQGWVYKDVVGRYFICTPSMMMRRSVLDVLGGYDESLAYEDFDFWVRSARQWKYLYSDQVLVKKRLVPGSWSTRQYEKKSRQLDSTLLVCQKAKELNNNREENKALAARLAYEIRQAIRSCNPDIATEMLKLKKSIYRSFLKDFLYQGLIWLSDRKNSR